MKFKIVLIVLFCFHLLAVLTINILYFPNNKFSLPDSELNWFGKQVINTQIDENRYNLKIFQYYSYLAGFNKPYEYFSPNIAEEQVDIEFLDQNNVKLNLINSLEGEIKLFVLKYQFQAIQQNKDLSHKILHSFCNRLFALNPDVKEINVYYSIKKIKQPSSKILVYKVNYE